MKDKQQSPLPNRGHFLTPCCSRCQWLIRARALRRTTASPAGSIQGRRGTCVTAGEPLRLPRAHSWCVRSVGLDTCRTICIHHYSIAQRISTALKILCASPVHRPNPWQPSFYCLRGLPFSECHTVGLIHLASQTGFSHLIICI